MNDLISRQAAIDAVERAKTARSADGEIFCAKINAQMNIQHLPSVQPEIVYCKDCESWQTDWKPKGCEHEDAHFCEMIGRVVCADHYCGYAEKKTDGN